MTEDPGSHMIPLKFMVNSCHLFPTIFLVQIRSICHFWLRGDGNFKIFTHLVCYFWRQFIKGSNWGPHSHDVLTLIFHFYLFKPSEYFQRRFYHFESCSNVRNLFYNFSDPLQFFFVLFKQFKYPLDQRKPSFFIFLCHFRLRLGFIIFKGYFLLKLRQNFGRKIVLLHLRYYSTKINDAFLFISVWKRAFLHLPIEHTLIINNFIFQTFL